MRAAAKAAAKDRHRAGRLAAEAAGPAPTTAVKVRKERLVIAVSAAAASEQHVLRVAQDGSRNERHVHAFSILPAVSDSSRSPRASPRTSDVPVSPPLDPVKSPLGGATALSSIKGSKLHQLAAPLLSPAKNWSPAASERQSSVHPTSDHDITDASETVVASLVASLRPMDGTDGCAALSIELPQDTTSFGDGEERTGEQMVDSLAYLVSSDSGAPMLAVPEAPYDPTHDDATGDEAHHSFWTLPSAVTGVRLVTIEEPVAETDVESAYAAAPAAPQYAIAVEQAVPVIGWVLLSMALVCSSISGALADLQTAPTFHSPPPGDMLRGAWRGSCSTLTLLSLQLYQSRCRPMLGLLRLSRGEVAELIGAGLALSVNLGAFQSSLMRTSIAHAATFESMSSLWLVLGELAAWLLLKGPAVSRTTIGAVMIGCFGALLCFGEPHHKGGAGHDPTPFGDALALSSGVGACFFLIAAEKLRHALEPLAFLTSVVAIYSLAAATAAFYIDPRPPSFSLNPISGLFGWLTLSPDRLLIQLGITAMVDVAGYLAYIAVMKYVPAIMVSAVMLLGPFVSTIEAMLIGVEAVPGLWTVAGAAVITVGSAVIAVESQRKTKTYALGEIKG
jgi:drug/metabolite transporter (DMT)-like permease